MKSKSCALAAGAVALVPAAHASIITVAVNQSVPTSTPGPSYDLTSNGGPDLTFPDIYTSPATAEADVTGNGSSSYASDGMGNPLDSAPGETIGPGNTFAQATGTLAGAKFLSGCGGNFPCDGSTQYLGFEWGTDYGYVTLSITGDAYNPPTIDLISFTYDNSGAPITISVAATAVPEPSSLALLAAGAAGIAALRKRSRRA